MPPVEPEPIAPTPPPLRGPAVLSQQWRDLSFVHWAVPADRVAPFMPRGVRPDVHAGQTYVGLVPFRMVGFGFGTRLPLPWLGTFLETNVRLYSVDATGRRGVVFLSLDCERALFVIGSRACLNIPYRWARMQHEVTPQEVTPASAGSGETPTGARHEYRTQLLRPALGPVDPAVRRAGFVTGRTAVRVGARRDPSPLDHFLTARWGVHTRHLGLDLYMPNQHPAWPLYDAELLVLEGEVLASVGLPELADRPPDHVAFSPGVRTEFGLPQSSRRPRRT